MEQALCAAFSLTFAISAGERIASIAALFRPGPLAGVKTGAQALGALFPVLSVWQMGVAAATLSRELAAYRQAVKDYGPLPVPTCSTECLRHEEQRVRYRVDADWRSNALTRARRALNKAWVDFVRDFLLQGVSAGTGSTSLLQAHVGFSAVHAVRAGVAATWGAVAVGGLHVGGALYMRSAAQRDIAASEAVKRRVDADCAKPDVNAMPLLQRLWDQIRANEDKAIAEAKGVIAKSHVKLAYGIAVIALAAVLAAMAMLGASRLVAKIANLVVGALLSVVASLWTGRASGLLEKAGPAQRTDNGVSEDAKLPTLVGDIVNGLKDRSEGATASRTALQSILREYGVARELIERLTNGTIEADSAASLLREHLWRLLAGPAARDTVGRNANLADSNGTAEAKKAA